MGRISNLNKTVAAADAILELLKTPPATPEPEPATSDTGTETPK